jgi:hypothetical protein
MKKDRAVVETQTAELAINEYRFVKVGSTSNLCTVATDGTVPIMGVSAPKIASIPNSGVTYAIGEGVDLYCSNGIVEVEAGGAIPLNSYVTAGVDGKGAVAVAGYVKGIALTEATADGDRIKILLTDFVL